MSKLFYDPTNAIHEILDNVSPDIRETLREDARPEHPPVRPVRPDDLTPKGHLLTNEFDHRDFSTEIEGGFAWLDDVPMNIRMLAEDSDNRVDVEKNRIVKVIRKRDPEYLQGEEQSFGVSSDGTRTPLNDDVYEQEGVEFVRIDSEFFTPRDKWDLLFDATPLLRRVEISREKLSKMTLQKRTWVLNKMADDLIYSSDWFPTKQKRKPFREDVETLMKMVRAGVVKKASVFALCNPISQKELDGAKRLYLKAQRMPNGEGKAALLEKAKKVQLSPVLELKKKTRWARVFEREETSLVVAKQELANTTNEEDRIPLKEEIEAITQRLHNARRKLFSLAKAGDGDYSEGLSITDKKNLWDAWYQAQIEQHGEVKLSKAKFRKMYYQQCFREVYPKALEKAEEALKAGNITEIEMKTRLKKIKNAIWRKVNQKANEIYRR